MPLNRISKFVTIVLFVVIAVGGVASVFAQGSGFGDAYIKASEAYNRASHPNTDSYTQRAEYLEAIRLYGEEYQSNPDNISALINRGVMYAAIGEHDKAIEDYTEVLERQPNDVTAL